MPGISPAIVLIKNDDYDKIWIEMYIFTDRKLSILTSKDFLRVSMISWDPVYWPSRGDKPQLEDKPLKQPPIYYDHHLN